MPAPTPQLRALLAEHAERTVHRLGVSTAAISWWDRDADVLRTLVNAGALHETEEPMPADETYPLDAFPAVAALLRHGRPYLDPPDVSSSAMLAHLRQRSQAALPLVVDGVVWGELWIASVERRLGTADLVALVDVAAELGRVLAEPPDG